MRVDINSDRATRLRVRDVLVDGEAVTRGTVICADEERGFVEKIIAVELPESGPRRVRVSAQGLLLTETLVGKVEIVIGLPQYYT